MVTSHLLHNKGRGLGKGCGPQIGRGWFVQGVGLDAQLQVDGAIHCYVMIKFLMVQY